MEKPDLPDNEPQRLAHLKALKILDTTPEARLDNITQLASGMFNVPVALISLVDENRQWFKSRCGLDAEQTSREISFCGHVVAAGKSLVVNDTSQDSRFADNPLTELEGAPVAFYAGAPLITSDGLVLGTLCLIDHQPREFAQRELEQLERLARIVMDELDLRSLLVESKHMERKLATKRRQLEGRNSKLLDLIERFKGTRSRLISAEKLATLGLLAAGVGQEASKAISTSRKHLIEAQTHVENDKCAGLISQSLDCQDELRRMMDAICDTTETAGNNELADTDLNDTVKHCRNVISSRFDDKVRIIFEPNTDLPRVRVVESQIFMALLNVLINAAESTHHKVAVKINLQRTDDMVIIRITDNGEGMPAEVRERATEAFFSTGKDRLHFGLGLSISNGIVRDHGGLLKVHSEPGKGTQVNIALPLKASAPQAKISVSDLEADVAKGSGD